MTKMRGEGFQKRLKPPKFKNVGLARIHYRDDHVECSCEWTFSHSRSKVVEDAIDRHLKKKHGGRGIRL